MESEGFIYPGFFSIVVCILVIDMVVVSGDSIVHLTWETLGSVFVDG